MRSGLFNQELLNTSTFKKFNSEANRSFFYREPYFYIASLGCINILKIKRTENTITDKLKTEI